MDFVKLKCEIDHLLESPNGLKNAEIACRQYLDDITESDSPEYVEIFKAVSYIADKTNATDEYREQWCSSILVRDHTNQEILLNRAIIRYQLNKIILSEVDFDALNSDFLQNKLNDPNISQIHSQVKSLAPKAKEEELKKLASMAKNVTNKVLGKFGLSLDSFEVITGADGTKSIALKK